MRRLLVLGGSAEAMLLAHRLAGYPHLQVISSLAGRTRDPVSPPGEIRIGGFGGSAGLASYLDTAGIDLMIDATHPFAARMAWNAFEASRRAGRPLVKLLRPAWRREAGDRWLPAVDAAAAAGLVRTTGRRAFLALGRQELTPFAACEETWFLVRMVDPPTTPLPLAAAEVLLARGPFLLADEIALLKRWRIDVVVSKNSGGGVYEKIAAARHCGVPVIMINRPDLPPGPSVADVDGAVAWVARQLR